MGRHYRFRVERGQEYLVEVPPEKARPYTAAWAAARQRRAERRAALALDIQTRDTWGFIVKITPEGIVMYDPGPIDRLLWCRAAQTTDDDVT